MPTIVYSYGIISLPKGSPELLEREVSGGHKYYNALIEVERDFLARKAALRRQYLAGLPEAEERIRQAEAEVKNAVTEIRAQNAVHKRKRATPAEKERLAGLKADLKHVRQERKAILSGVQSNPAYLHALEQMHADLLAAKRDAYAAATCSWGTRLKVAQAVELAMTTTTPDGKKIARSPEDPPRFRRWTGDGLAAIQIQNGVMVGDFIEGRCPKLRVERVNEKRSVFFLRLGVGEDRLPILLNAYASYPAGRPLPQDGRIMWAVVVRRRGPHRRMADGKWKPWDKYELQLTVRTGHVKPQTEAGICGVDVGWRQMEDGGLRVAYWVGDSPVVIPDSLKPHIVLHAADGSAGELRIDPSRWLKVDDLQSIRDGHLEDTKQTILNWIEACAESTTTLPDWLAAEVATLAAWKSPGRLCRLFDRWERFPGDEMIYAILKQFREKEAHLWQWQRSQETKAQRWRLCLYRQFAAMLAKHYRVLSVEDCDWRQLARLPVAESNESVNTVVRRHMRIASVGYLRTALQYSGARATFSRTENTTRECHACGMLNKWDREKELRHRCTGCVVEWDQDANAARVLLARAKVAAENVAAVPAPEGMNGETVTADVPVRGGRWQRRKANRSRKDGKSSENAGQNT